MQDLHHMPQFLLVILFTQLAPVLLHRATKSSIPLQNAATNITGYKIATKCIAHRIAKVLPKLINDDQTGYVKGRYIGQNIRLINDIMKITELENIPGMAIFVDFKKAFDTVDWNFLFKTLEALNFGPQLLQWIRTFYTDCSSCVVNNGYASVFFKLQRSVRQGCPPSVWKGIQNFTIRR